MSNAGRFTGKNAPPVNVQRCQGLVRSRKGAVPCRYDGRFEFRGKRYCYQHLKAARERAEGAKRSD